MTARYIRHGHDFCLYRLDGDSKDAQALRLMAWVTASNGWVWVVD
jgi:hypothetical protein